MALGYEGYVKIGSVNGSGGDLVLATGASFPTQKNRLESTAAYKGTQTTGINYPHEYDYDSFDGSVNVDLTKPFFDNQVKPWLLNRLDSKEVFVQVRNGSGGTANAQRAPEAYWNNISIDVTPNAPVTSTVSFISWKKFENATGSSDYDTIVDNYIGNRTGLLTSTGQAAALLPGGSIAALNASGTNTVPIPHWKTFLTPFTGSRFAPVGWSLTFQQDVVRQFLCGHTVNPAEPAILTFGPLTATLQVELMVWDGSFIVPTSTSVSATICDLSNISVGTCELVNFADDIKDASSPTSITLNYDIYGPLS